MVSWPVGALQGSFPSGRRRTLRTLSIRRRRHYRPISTCRVPAMHTEVRHGKICPAARVPGTTDDRRGKSGHGCLRGRGARLREHRTFAPCALSGCRRPRRRGANSGRHLTRRGRHRRLPRIRSCHRPGLRRGITAGSRSGGTTRRSDVGVPPVLGMDWKEYEDQGHGVLGNASPDGTNCTQMCRSGPPARPVRAGSIRLRLFRGSRRQADVRDGRRRLARPWCAHAGFGCPRRTVGCGPG